MLLPHSQHARRTASMAVHTRAACSGRGARHGSPSCFPLLLLFSFSSSFLLLLLIVVTCSVAACTPPAQPQPAPLGDSAAAAPASAASLWESAIATAEQEEAGAAALGHPRLHLLRRAAIAVLVPAAPAWHEPAADDHRPPEDAHHWRYQGEEESPGGSSGRPLPTRPALPRPPATYTPALPAAGEARLSTDQAAARPQQSAAGGQHVA